MTDPLKKDETIAGGAFLAADGETWVDAEGKPLEGDALDAAKARAAKHAAADKKVFAAEQKRRAAAGLPALPEPVEADDEAAAAQQAAVERAEAERARQAAQQSKPRP